MYSTVKFTWTCCCFFHWFSESNFVGTEMYTITCVMALIKTRMFHKTILVQIGHRDEGH